QNKLGMENHYENDLLSFQRFLKDFCSNVIESEREDDVLPIKILNKRFQPDELQGECFEWTLRYLGNHNCPPTLTSLIAREVYQEAKKIDYLEFEYGRNRELENIKDSEEKIVTPEKHTPVLDAALICDHVIDLIHDLCKKWAESLPPSIFPPKVSSAYYHEIRNTRRKMEDRHVIIPDFNTLFGIKDQPHQSYYAVFDGHAGTEAAVYASTHLHLHMTTSDKFSTDPPAALKYSYTTTDNNFMKKAEHENLKSGSTGVSVFIRGDQLHVAWLGDSQAALVRDGELVELVNPHKPEREDERERVESLGGCVLYMGAWRVNGNLAVSRAIGDVSQKKYICSDADTAMEKLDGTEDYLVLACDGLWDSVNNDDLPKRVHNLLTETGGDKSAVAKDLVTWAKESGSSDNITVIVVFLRDDVAVPKVKQIFNFGETPSSQDGKGQEDDKEGKSGGNNSDRSDSNNENQDTSSKNSNDLPRDNDIIVSETVDLDVKKSQECSENDQSVRPVDLSVSSPRGKMGRNSSKLESLSDNPLPDINQSESVMSEKPPSRHKLTKNEPIFIYESPVNQVSPRVVSSFEESQNKGRESSTNRATSLPNRGYLSSSSDTVSDFHHKLKMDGFQETGKKKLPSLHETPMVSEYVVDSDAEKEMKKEIFRKKTKRLRKPYKEFDTKESSGSPTRTRKRIDHSGPVVWAFTGKNVAPVQNYKLNQAAKSSHPLISPRIALANLANNSVNDNYVPSNADIRYLDKITKSKYISSLDSKNTENIPMPHNVFDYPLSTFTSSYSSPLKSSANSLNAGSDISSNYSGKSTDRSSKLGFQPWRPKRMTKFVGSNSFTEVPPTPLTNTKIHPPANEYLDR
ncbi:hypothetical protein FSP39_025185, partial [Pinctada imbricata]